MNATLRTVKWVSGYKPLSRDCRWSTIEPFVQLLLFNHHDNQPWKSVPSGLSKLLALSAWHGLCPWEKKKNHYGK